MRKPVFKSTTSSPPDPADYTLEVVAGEHIFQEGELGTEMFLIQSGRVEIYTRSEGKGRKERSLAKLERGDFFGEMAILEDRPRSAAARAITDVRLLRINGSTFTQMIQSNPEIAVRMMKKLSYRLRETDDMLREALSRTGQVPRSEEPGSALATQARGAATARTQGRHDQVLVHEPTGMEFSLSASAETTIGRRDPVTGIFPDVDLTPVDHQRSISRRHAKIYRRGDKFFFVEETGTMNGTFKNGQRLETGAPEEIRSGDELRCGVVSLRFVTD